MKSISIEIIHQTTWQDAPEIYHKIQKPYGNVHTNNSSVFTYGALVPTRICQRPNESLEDREARQRRIWQDSLSSARLSSKSEHGDVRASTETFS